jgi:hypothetical protein
VKLADTMAMSLTVIPRNSFPLLGGQGVPGVRGVVVRTLAKASESFLLAAVSVAMDVVSAKVADVSCCRTVVSSAAARARLSRAVPKWSMEAAGAGKTK